MTRVDQFESVFRAAAKEPFVYREPRIEQVLVITDLTASGAQETLATVRRFLRVLEAPTGPTWRAVSGEEFRSVGELLTLVQSAGPDLICTYRHLHSDAWKWPYSLGEFLDVLTQATDVPVIVLPHPKAARASAHALENTDRVMAMTDHLTGDHRLVSFAARLTASGGTLYLTHVEDQNAFERYLEVIAKIPSIDTENARETIARQLLKEPGDYVQSCRVVLAEADLPIQVEAIVGLGARLVEYRRLVDEHLIDLLVMNTKDREQLAIHGLAYPLAIELRQIPILLL